MYRTVLTLDSLVPLWGRIFPVLFERFEEAFGVGAVSVKAVRHALFVGVNSMALHGDGCDLCMTATQQLRRIHGVWE